MTDWSSARRLGCAAALSALAHAAAITFGHVGLPQRDPDLPPLAVRIEAEPVAQPASGSVRASAPKPRAAPVPEGQFAALAPVQPDAASAPEPQPEAAPEATPTPAAAAEPAAAAAQADSAARTEARQLPAFPRRGRITFNLVYGSEHFPVGQTIQTWQVDSGRYQISSRSETTGLADLLRSQHRAYSSRGTLTEDGLRPEAFTMNRNRGRGRPLEEASARFLWERGTLVLGPPAKEREERLPPGSQDLMSFMYQLAIAPPAPGRLQMSVTNGTRVEIYVLEVLREQKMETPLGELRVLPVRQVRTPGEESIDVWLAVEYRHLPVRIRFHDRDGLPSGEQIVTEIRLSDD